MRKFTLLSLILLLALSINARERSLIMMQQAAWNVLHNKQTRTSSLTSLNTLELLKDCGEVAIIGNKVLGFALIAKDIQHNAVLGYSYNTFVGLDRPLKWYINEVNQALKTRALLTPIPHDYGYAQEVKPFVETTWDQGEPYNLLCPKNKSGQHFITGCVATAMSQIMRYYKYPKTGNGINSYGFTPPANEGEGKNIELDFSKTTYDWDNMLLHYNKGKWNTAQANAVSTLMYHCGVSVSMQYSMSFSSAFTREAHQALIKYFRYDKNANIFAREFFSNKEWMRMVYGELNAKRPIYYTGVDASVGGHAFVLCGYDKEGKVYVNWGWSGNSNGYYDISILHPNNTSMSFSKWQDMIIGISPQKAVDHQSHICQDRAFNVSKFGRKNISCNGDNYVINRGASFFGDVAIIMESKEHQYILSQTSISEQNPIPTYDKRDLPGNFYMSATLPKNVVDGTYYIYMGSKDKDDTKWRLVRHWNGNVNNFAGAIVIIQDGKIKSVDKIEMQTKPTVINTPRVDNTTITRVYNLQGQKILQVPTARFTINMLPVEGVFIIKQGNKTTKILK